MLIATATQPAPSLREGRAEAPDVVTAIVDRALAYERADRWQDARAMQAAVRRAMKIDFDAPRPPAMSLVDASLVAPAPGEVAIPDALHAAGGDLRGPAPAGSRGRRHRGGDPADAHGKRAGLRRPLRPTWRARRPPASPAPRPPQAPPVAAPAQAGNPDDSSAAASLARPTVVLGSFIAAGLLGAGVVIGLLTQHPARLVVVPAAVTRRRSRARAVPPAPPPPAPPSSASAVTGAEAPSAAPPRRLRRAPPPGPKKRPSGPRRRPGRGRFNPGGLWASLRPVETNPSARSGVGSTASKIASPSAPRSWSASSRWRRWWWAPSRRR